MKKSLIALAVAGAFAVPAMAATSNIDISGKIAADVTSVSGTGTTAGGVSNNTRQVNNNNSVITVAGNEDLGGGMKAFFSVTYGLPLASAGALSGQNQIAGLEGGFGKVFVGAFDNPLKVMGRGVDLFADQSTGDSRYMTSVGAMEARANDVIAYISPSFSGFQVVVANTNNPLGAVATKGANNTEMTIIKLAYTNGPLSLAAGRHTVDSAGVTAGQTGDESAWRLTGSYKFGDLKVVGSYGKVSDAYNKTNGAAGEEVKTWGLGAAYGMGPITLKAQYYSLNDKVVNADANMWALGADYALSKRTTAQFAYSKVTNDTAVAYGGCTTTTAGFGNTGATAAVPVAGTDPIGIMAGKDPSRLSIGLKHTF